jgi:hypothetical protein
MRKLLMLAALAASAASPLLAQGTPFNKTEIKSPTASQWTALAKLPDWSGVWQPTFMRPAKGAAFVPPPKPVLTPAAQRLADAFEAGKKKGENLQNQLANCVPPGMPGIMQMPYPIEWLFTPGRVTLAIETESQVRRIYMDGRALPTDPDPQFNGTSIGHWEGDTLVIDTVGFTPEITFTGGVHPSEKMKIHETYRLKDPNTLVGTITLTDPETLAKPYTINAAWTRHRDWTMREYVCQENNRDASDAEGRPSMNLGLDDKNDPFGDPPPDSGKSGQ